MSVQEKFKMCIKMAKKFLNLTFCHKYLHFNFFKENHHLKRTNFEKKAYFDKEVANTVIFDLSI